MAFLKELLNARWLESPSAEQLQFLDQVARLVGANHSEPELSEFLALRGPTEAQLVLLAGFSESLARAEKPLHQLLRNPRGPWRAQIDFLQTVFKDATAAVVNPQLKNRVRLAALRLLVLSRTEPVSSVVFSLLQPDQAMELQTAAARAIGELDDHALAHRVFANWSQYATSTRRLILASALRSPQLTAVLLENIERQTISLFEFEVSSREALQKNPDPALKLRIVKLFQDLNTPDRATVVQSFEPALKLTGDLRAGAVIFAKSCLPCHSVQGTGGKVGPDLGISTRPLEMLLVEVVDPSRQVPPNFINYTVVTTQGETLNGLIAAETGTSITLRRQNQNDETILRSQIKELKAEGKSIMPDGLEQGLSHQDMADLLQFLRRADKELLPK